jgi:hypothetical protein
MSRTFRLHLEELADRVVLSVVHAEYLCNSAVIESVPNTSVTHADTSGTYAAEIGTYAVANQYISNDEYTSEYNDEGELYELWFNFRNDTINSGSVTVIGDYRDAGLDLVLIEESFSGSRSSLTGTRVGGEHNEETFEQTSQTLESWSGAVSLYRDSIPVDAADGVETTFSLTRMMDVAEGFFMGQLVLLQLPTSPIPGPRGTPQNLYNQIIMRIGEKAQANVVQIELQKMVMADIALNNKASGSFILDQGGYVIVANMGFRKQLDNEKSGSRA